ncbi:MAG: efflux transporter periplasmic adaptor subunit, partial [Glaciecola sp.]
LSWGANGAFVWLADSSGAQPLAKRVNVQVQQRLRGRILVSGDLRDGESLVVEGIQSLRPGQALNIQNDNPGAQISRKPKQQQVAG